MANIIEYPTNLPWPWPQTTTVPPPFYPYQKPDTAAVYVATAARWQWPIERVEAMRSDEV